MTDYGKPLPLLNDDVLHCIVQSVSIQDHRTLFALALTCRRISEPALDILWSHLLYPYYLAALMPQEHWRVDQEVTRGYIVRKITMTSAPRTGDWIGDRFKQYARRVRMFRPSNHILRTVDESVFDAWSTCATLNLAPTKLELVHTHFPWNSRNIIPFASHLINNNLTRLEISSPVWNKLAAISPMYNLVEDLPSVCPRLRHLYIDIFGFRSRVSNSDFAFENLRTLVVNSIVDTTTVQQLARLPKVEILHIACGAEPAIEFHDTSFPALRVLKIRSDTFDIMRSILDAIASQQLNVFSCEMTKIIHTNTLVSLVLCLANYHSGASITEVNICCHLRDSTRPVDFALAFGPLSYLPSLEKLRLKTGCNAIINEPDAQTLIKEAWPRIQTFVFPNPPLVSFPTLLSATERWPHLSKLPFGLNLESMNVPKLVATTNTNGRSRLQLLTVGGNINEGVLHKVACILKSVFPSMHRITKHRHVQGYGHRIHILNSMVVNMPSPYTVAL